MEQEILVPDIGDYTNVEIIEVAIKEGEYLKKDATMLTLETDKATMDIPAPMELKIIKVCVKPGDRVSKGSLIATATNMALLDATELGRKSKRLQTSDSINNNSTTSNQNVDIETSKFCGLKSQANLNNVSTEHQNFTNNGLTGFVNATPSVRKFARELGVDLAHIIGTDQRGRISVDDVKNYVHNIMTNYLNDSLKKSSVIVNQEHNKTPIKIDFSKWGNIEEQPLSRIKKKSGKNLHNNWLNIPHVTHFDSADITYLEQFRKEKQITIKENCKLTPLVFLIKAVVNALKKYPNFNSSLSIDQEKLIIKKYYNIGIAVDTNLGLVVPVIKKADLYDIIGLSKELIDLTQKARENKLLAEDLQGGCFTISSLGGIGGHAFTPIINSPEVAILGVSRHKINPVYVDNQLCPRLILPFSLSYDHRAIDGVEAAKFCKFIVEQLEDHKFYV